MKALSIRQPWCSMIATGEKTIEARSWFTKIRGDILLCASKKPQIDNLPIGQALAIGTLIDCVPFQKCHTDLACCNYMPDYYAWIFSNVRPVKPFPVKGQLGIFDIDYKRG